MEEWIRSQSENPNDWQQVLSRTDEVANKLMTLASEDVQDAMLPAWRDLSPTNFRAGGESLFGQRGAIRSSLEQWQGIFLAVAEYSPMTAGVLMVDTAQWSLNGLMSLVSGFGDSKVRLADFLEQVFSQSPEQAAHVMMAFPAQIQRQIIEIMTYEQLQKFSPWVPMAAELIREN